MPRGRDALEIDEQEEKHHAAQARATRPASESSSAELAGFREEHVERSEDFVAILRGDHPLRETRGEALVLPRLAFAQLRAHPRLEEREVRGVEGPQHLAATRRLQREPQPERFGDRVVETDPRSFRTDDDFARWTVER